eukprot:gb/GECH01008540.1/.p1 GENE.gb/GECH01008540.1/~~gb/GECH01008540.1/.p1  ORF type:complete len:242 (+),score=61.10 gb/GECH01008540.1/:1-726(+)
MSKRVRGGHGRFSWEDIKSDKQKDHFLGQSVKLQSNWIWESKPEKKKKKKKKKKKEPSKEKLNEEKKQAQEEEQQLMLETLGLRPKKKRNTERRLEKHEVKELLDRDGLERDNDTGERVTGVGFDPAPRHKDFISQAKSNSDSKELSEYDSEEQSDMKEEHEPKSEDIQRSSSTSKSIVREEKSRRTLDRGNGNRNERSESERKKRKHRKRHHEKRELDASTDRSPKRKRRKTASSKHRSH